LKYSGKSWKHYVAGHVHRNLCNMTRVQSTTGEIPFMQRFLSIALALCVGLTLSLDANAKRFGGGKSSGYSPDPPGYANHACRCTDRSWPCTGRRQRCFALAGPTGRPRRRWPAGVHVHG
jgi:hypothetical protein